jgi:hypothetical protein
MTLKLVHYVTISINFFIRLQCSKLPISKDTADTDTLGVS